MVHSFIIHRFFQCVFANLCYQFQPFFVDTCTGIFREVFQRCFLSNFLNIFSQVFSRVFLSAIFLNFDHRFFHRVFHRLIFHRVLNFEIFSKFRLCKIHRVFHRVFTCHRVFHIFSQRFHRFSSNSGGQSIKVKGFKCHLRVEAILFMNFIRLLQLWHLLGICHLVGPGGWKFVRKPLPRGGAFVNSSRSS